MKCVNNDLLSTSASQPENTNVQVERKAILKNLKDCHKVRVQEMVESVTNSIIDIRSRGQRADSVYGRV